jgi:hypothetical protein
MNKLHKILMLVMLLLTVGLTGCISTVDIEDQLHETQKLVLYCRIFPGMDTVKVHLSHTQLLYGSGSREDIQIIGDGVVELSTDKQNWHAAQFDSIQKLYLLPTADFPVVEGQTYYIRAIARNYDEVTSTCTVPFAHDIYLHWEHILNQNDTHDGVFYNNPHYDTYLTWNDYAEEKNYYAFGTLWEVEYDDDWTEVEMSRYYTTYFSLMTLYEGSKVYNCFSDEGRDGKTIRYLYEYDTDYEEDDEMDEEVEWILFLDEHCYLYESTLNDLGALSTFLLEPIQTYNNIEGGFGLFGAFALQHVEHDKKQ